MILLNRSRKALNSLSGALAEKTVAEQLAAAHLHKLRTGSLGLQIPDKLAGTELGSALLLIDQHLRDKLSDEEQRTWGNAGLAKFADILRNKDSLKLDQLADQVITDVVRYTEANQGALFILQEENQDAFLEMLACYAYDRKKFVNKRIGLGEGLAGQCVLEKDVIHLRQTPPDYVSITSGLGEATPREVLITPLIINDTVFGVLELASFKAFPDYKIAFLRKLCENIAAGIKTVRENERIVTLLNASQQQTEALRAQEEELRQNMEELQATQEEMQRRNQEISRASAEMLSVMRGIDSTMARIEFTPEGTILDANKNFLGAVGYSLEGIKGKHHSIFVPEDIRASAEYRTFWKRLANGEALTGLYRRKSADGRTVWLNAVYNPIFNHLNEVVKVIKFATNVTAQQESIAESKGVMDGINETMATISFSADGHVLEANQNFLEAVKYPLSEIVGKHHRIFVPEDVLSSTEYAHFWKRLSEGEAVKGLFKRMTSSNETIWLNATYNPILDADGKVSKVMKFATIADPGTQHTKTRA